MHQEDTVIQERAATQQQQPQRTIRFVFRDSPPRASPPPSFMSDTRPWTPFRDTEPPAHPPQPETRVAVPRQSLQENAIAAPRRPLQDTTVPAPRPRRALGDITTSVAVSTGASEDQENEGENRTNALGLSIPAPAPRATPSSRPRRTQHTQTLEAIAESPEGSPEQSPVYGPEPGKPV